MARFLQYLGQRADLLAVGAVRATGPKTPHKTLDMLITIVFFSFEENGLFGYSFEHVRAKKYKKENEKRKKN